MGVADPDRLIKRGWSAGGHMTNSIVTFTDRLKAAFPGRGRVNWVRCTGRAKARVPDALVRRDAVAKGRAD